MLRYRLEGSGPPLLLIHGWGVTYAIWQNLAPLLTPHFQLVMVELPGIGGSPLADPQQSYYAACAQEIEEVRQALKIESWSILAYSTGTRVAEAYVQHYASRVRRVIFLCPIHLISIWSLIVRLLDTTHPPQVLTHWLFSNWRLYGLVLALGFNGRKHHYTRVWQTEIELQPVDTLVRMLCDLPGKGRAPFKLSTVPTLFIWGDQDALTIRPRSLRHNDVVIPANHSAPMLAAASVADAVIPFLIEGRISPQMKHKRRWQERRSKQEARPRSFFRYPSRRKSRQQRLQEIDRR